MRAVEDAVGVQIPPTARLIRNILHGAQFQHDHIVHFYHLHALDWVDVISALKADPVATAVLSDQTTRADWGGSAYFKKVKQRLQTFVDSGQLGPFTNGYWGHRAYRLPPEANLLACAHYIEALRIQAKAARMHAIFGGKNPHPQSLVVGGVTCIADLTPDRIVEFLYITKETQDFIENIYYPDLVSIASYYKDWGRIGGTTNFLTWGEFPQSGKEPESLFMPRGMVLNRNLSNVQSADPTQVTEDVTRAWYEDDRPRHPSQGVTQPRYGNYDTNTGKYSWLKAPRYDAMPCEVGPLARVLVAYGKGDTQIRKWTDSTLSTLGLAPEALFSTLGRTAARCIETVIIGQALQGWITELTEIVGHGPPKTVEQWRMPDSARGSGLNDVPRGALGHWIDIEKKKIKNYQYVVPSTWNLGPRCSKGRPGPVEEALIGTPVADPAQPVEILRTVHSFDPCIACAVHVIDPDSNQVYRVRVL